MSCILLTISANVGIIDANEYKVVIIPVTPAKSGINPAINPRTKPIKKLAKTTHQ